MRTFHPFAFAILAASAVLPAACAKQSDTTGSGGGGAPASTSTSAGGNGGTDFIGSGGSVPSCTDPTDKDGDNIADFLESGDSDGDGVLDKDSLDSDGDGYPDELEAGLPDDPRETTCDVLTDTDGDGTPDFKDPDSDDDGVPDSSEKSYDPDGTKGCWRTLDCDADGVIDLIEVAAKTDPTDKMSQPLDPALYFVLPYNKGEQTKDFTFSAGVVKADIYFLVDTTVSMQPAIDALKASISATIIPKILNGDANAVPPIPAIKEAWIGIGSVRDVPWTPYGEAGDDMYLNRFMIDGQKVLGNVQPPGTSMGKPVAPASVTKILSKLKAAGGNDSPEATSQALWMAATNKPYAATIGGVWSPLPAECEAPNMVGIPCFRPQGTPIFVIITDAPMHNGPPGSGNNYDASKVGGTKTYDQAVQAIKDINGRIVGVPVDNGTPGKQRADLEDLALKTDSLYYDPAFGGSKKPLVSGEDVTTGEVSTEVVRMLGLLADVGVHNVTTARSNYSCPAGMDCNDDSVIDAFEEQGYENPIIAPETKPFDSSKLMTAIEPVASPAPVPYDSLDKTTFYGVRGDAQVTFRVHAENKLINQSTLIVLRGLIRVQTPEGQVLGGPAGIKLVYFVIPPNVAF